MVRQQCLQRLLCQAQAWAWGWFVQLYAASDFHVRDGGLFGSTNFASWMASCVVFLGAAVMAVKGARSALLLKI
jgi:hypothetical protein